MTDGWRIYKRMPDIAKRNMMMSCSLPVRLIQQSAELSNGWIKDTVYCSEKVSALQALATRRSSLGLRKVSLASVMEPFPVGNRMGGEARGNGLIRQRTLQSTPDGTRKN